MGETRFRSFVKVDCLPVAAAGSFGLDVCCYVDYRQRVAKIKCQTQVVAAVCGIVMNL